tara:strand:- start:9312 stop:9572 length:261 start_codon:yes stop_codon:yes gene_type:complete
MREIFVSLTLSVFLASCGGSSNSSCTECGGGLVDGFLYKEVTVEDIAGLAEINVTTDVGKCIRFKLDEADFSEATIVDDCCCIEYQ